MRPAIRAAVTSARRAYSAEATTLFAAMTSQPTTARKGHIDALIVGLKADGIWPSLDVLYLLAAHDSQAARLNWRSPGNHTAIEVNSPTFQTDRGYTGDGSTSRLRTQFTPSTDGGQYRQNSASIWVWSRTDLASNTAYEAGAATSPQLRVNGRTAGGLLALVVNDATVSGTATADSLGMYGASRNVSTTKKAWKNGVQVGSDFAITSTGENAQELWICGANSTLFSARQVAFMAVGESLAGLELAFYNRVRAYMQAVGAA